MTTACAVSLFDELCTLGLLETRQSEMIAADDLHRFQEPLELGKALVQREWLTPYQLDQLIQGRGKDLVVGHYQLLEPLGEGGMGQVFKAWDPQHHRPVALKVILRERVSQDPTAVQRFQREARATAQLNHTNVVRFYDADESADTHYIAMEYVEGIDLAKLVRYMGPLPVALACEYVRQAAHGLQHAHEQGLVHRDIKPSNLLVTVAPSADEDEAWLRRRAMSRCDASRISRVDINMLQGGLVKILDMGLALLEHSTSGQDIHTELVTQIGVVMGTPDFIAPEQARNPSAVDIRADLYSLGCTLYYLLTARAPFADGNMVEKLLMHQLDQPRPIEDLRGDVPGSILAVVNKLMAKQPKDRYQTPAELVAVLDRLCQALQMSEAPPMVVEEQKLTPTAIVGATPPGLVITREIDLSGEPAPAKRILRLRGHRGWVTSLAFSPNRDLLASGGVDGSVRLWGLSSKLPKEQILAGGQTSEIHALTFSPCQNMLAAGSGGLDGRIWIWLRTDDGWLLRSLLEGHKAPVSSLVFSHDGTMLVSASCDKTVRTWDLAQAEPRAKETYKGHVDFVRAVTVAPDGKTVASAGHDGTIRLWAVGKFWSKSRAVLRGHSGQIRSISYRPDGLMLASGGLDQTVQLWDMQGSRPTLAGVLPGHGGVVRLVHYTHDGRYLVTVDDRGKALVREAETGNKLSEWVLPSVMDFSAAVTRDGRYLATGNSDGDIGVFRLYAKD